MVENAAEYAGIYLTVSLVLGIALGRMIGFGGNDEAEHPLVIATPRADFAHVRNAKPPVVSGLLSDVAGISSSGQW